MSYRMHNYRLLKSEWWPFARDVRAHYLAEHPIAKLFRGGLVPKVRDTTTYCQFTQLVDAITGRPDDDWTAALQLFDEGDSYLIRPLERGYFFMNDADRWREPHGLAPVTYDDRTDVPPEDEANRSVAEWVDERIHANEYLVFHLLDRGDLESILFDSLFQRVKEPHDASA